MSVDASSDEDVHKIGHNDSVTASLIGWLHVFLYTITLVDSARMETDVKVTVYDTFSCSHCWSTRVGHIICAVNNIIFCSYGQRPSTLISTPSPGRVAGTAQ